MADWQPISTAPKGDESVYLPVRKQPRILLFGYIGPNNRPHIAIGRWNQRNKRWASERDANNAEDILREPTHWMPLPEPPK